ncbi:MAG: phosphatidylserine decarboxylase family protein [Nitrospira sp.]|nr:phosphatidylserine decarboxylase family protein [Nitrospira sp.]
MIKFAPEGYPFIFGFLFITFIASLLLLWSSRSGGSQISFYVLLGASLLSFVVTIFMCFFFRDPERKIPEGKGIFVSPADGKVILVKDVHEKEHLNSDVKEISIFMSPLDVHVNRAPCDGKVSVVKYSPGKFMAAYRDDASLQNENIVMVLDSEKDRALVRQVAGFVARRAVCRVKAGDMLKRGERYGLIKFSSRLDVYLPKDAQIKVRPGDKVKAGETVIAVNSKQ